MALGRTAAALLPVVLVVSAPSAPLVRLVVPQVLAAEMAATVALTPTTKRAERVALVVAFRRQMPRRLAAEAAVT